MNTATDTVLDAALPTIPAGDHRVNDKGERYFVFAETKNGAFYLVHESSNYDRAVESANVWDELVNVEFLTHKIPMDYMSVGLRKFAALEESIRTAP
jgi:hypothetical protein